MTTGIITIQEFVGREVIYCVSSLIDELRKKEGCIEEDVLYDLYKGPIDYGAAKYELELERDYVFKHFCTEDNRYYFGVRNEHGTFKVDPIYNSESEAIAEWFEVYHGGDLEDYRSEIYEHWLVTPYFGRKLVEEGEVVIEMYNLHIWARSTTGQSITQDYVIQTIYNELISK